MPVVPSYINRKGPMSEPELRALVNWEIYDSIGWVGGEITERRREMLDRYYARPYGNEREGQSQMVMSDVQDTVESLLTDMMEVFASGDKVVEFKPTGKEDEEFAKQATDLVNYEFLEANDGFSITYDCLKDALIQINGFAKIWWDEQEEVTTQTYSGQTIEQVQFLEADPELEVTEFTEVSQEPENPQGQTTYDLTVKRTRMSGKLVVDSVPPEEFLVARRTVKLEESPFTCHKTKKTVTDLLEMGIEQEVIDKIPSHDEQDFNEERIARFEDEDEWPTLQSDNADPAMREIWIYECFLKIDYDGDGLAELRQITVAGQGRTVLFNDPVDEHPFVTFTPIKMPHKMFGRSLAELVEDIAKIKTSIVRQLLDNMYNINNARTAINEDVDLDSALDNRVGGFVLVNNKQSPGQSILPMPVQPIGPVALTVLEYMDKIRELRTGVTRYGQMLDENQLNSTAWGLNQLMGKAAARSLMVARIFAETGFKPMFKKMLRILVKNQDQQRAIRLRGDWVQMDPKSWNADMDASVVIGGSRQQQATMARMILDIQEKIMVLQGGPEGPIVTLENIHNTLEDMTSAAGVKYTERHFSDPQSPKMQEVVQQKQQNKKPSPEEQKIQMEAQVQAQKLKLEEQKMQLDHQREMEKIRLEDERERIEMELEDRRKTEELHKTIGLKTASEAARAVGTA